LACFLLFGLLFKERSIWLFKKELTRKNIGNMLSLNNYGDHYINQFINAFIEMIFFVFSRLAS